MDKSLWALLLSLLIAVPSHAQKKPWWERDKNPKPPEARMDPWPVIDPDTISSKACLDDNAPIESEACWKYFMGAVVQVMLKTNAQGEPYGWGTGFFIKKDLIVTNWHVAELEVGKELPVRWLFRPEEGQPPVKAKTVVVAKNYYRDLALLRLTESQNFSTVLQMESVENLQNIRPQTPVVALGFPAQYNKRAPFMTRGHISAYPVLVTVGDHEGNSYWPKYLISHTALTYGGNSGGPLISAQNKKLLGVNCSGNKEGYRDAVPGLSLLHVLARFEKGKPAASGWLGVEEWGQERNNKINEKAWKILGKWTKNRAGDYVGLPIVKVNMKDRPTTSGSAPLGEFEEGSQIIEVNGVPLKDLKEDIEKRGTPLSAAAALAIFTMQYFEGDRLFLTLYKEHKDGDQTVWVREVALRARPDVAPYIDARHP